MPVKYVRENEPRRGETGSYAPPALFGGAAQTDPKRRLLLIYIGLGVVIVGLAYIKAWERSDTFDGQKVLRGVAFVAAKEGAVLTLEIAGVKATHQPEPEILERLDPGDRVAVLYQRSRHGRQVRILEIGAVPLRARVTPPD